MNHPVTAILDANILYPAPLRDLFIRLAKEGLIRAKWTDEIHDEWIRNVLKDKPELNKDRIERTRQLMNEAVRDCLVTGYENLIETITLPDPDDRHVLAAAIHSNSSVIVTMNLKDFPSDILSSMGINAIHPDDFLCSLFHQTDELFCAIVKKQRTSLRNPPRSVEELLSTFENLGLKQLVGLLLPNANSL